VLGVCFEVSVWVCIGVDVGIEVDVSVSLIISLSLGVGLSIIIIMGHIWKNGVWEMGTANREMAKWHHINLGSLQGQTRAEK